MRRKVLDELRAEMGKKKGEKLRGGEVTPQGGLM